MTLTADGFRAATQLRACTVAIVASRDGNGDPVGLAAALVLPVSTDPPEMLVALNRTSRTVASLLAAGAFSVNLLSEAHEALCRRFASAEEREARFADPVWSTLTTGMPVLSDALASFDCRLKTVAESGTHVLLTGSVVDLGATCREEPPLIHYLGGYRRLA